MVIAMGGGRAGITRLARLEGNVVVAASLGRRPPRLRTLALPARGSSSTVRTQSQRLLVLSSSFPSPSLTATWGPPLGRVGRRVRGVAVARRHKASLADEMAAKASAGYTSPTTTASSSSSSSSASFSQWHQALEAFLRKTRTLPIPRWITPRHYSITGSEVLGHASFLLVALSYAVDDFLLLRCIAVAGSTAMLFFTYYHPHGRVLWLPFKWNALFIALNSYRIGRVLWHRYQAHQLPDELLKLRENYLFLMDPVDYYKLIRLGKVETVPRGSVMATQGQRSPHVRLLLSGECKVLRDGKLNYLLEEANFVAESGIHAGLLIPGSVESCCTIVVAGDADARFVVWDRTALVDLLNHDASVRRSLQAAISWDVVRKLKFQRSLLADGWIDDDPEAWTQRRTAQTQHRYTAILQNMLRYPRLLQARKPQLEIYRMIHHIDDAMHAQALQSCGWTVQEYEAGHRDRDDAADQDWHDVDHDSDVQDVVTHRDWKWYLYDIYYRFFG